MKLKIVFNNEVTKIFDCAASVKPDGAVFCKNLSIFIDLYLYLE